MADKIVLKYVGKGRTVPGIPARDLTQADVDKFAGKHRLLKYGWWVEVKEKPSTGKAKQDVNERKEVQTKS